MNQITLTESRKGKIVEVRTMPDITGKDFLKKDKKEIDNEYTTTNEKELKGSGEQEDTKETSKENESLENSKEKFASNEKNEYINNDDSETGESKEDAGFDEKYVNYLKSTYGFSDDEITEKTVKLAKSDIEKQRYGSQLRSDLEKYKKTVEGVESTFEKNPKLYEAFKSTIQGEDREENQQTQESEKDKPSNTSDKLKTSVTEQELIDQGYLDASSLEGLQDYERKLEIKSAMVDYKADKRLEDFERSLEQKTINRDKKDKQKAVSEENQKRFDNGIDDLIAKYQVNFDENPDLYKRIAKRAASYRDLDTKYIDEKAVELAAQRELGDKLQLRESQRKQPEERKRREKDTGFNVNKSKSTNSGKQETSIWDKIDEKANFYNGRGADRKAAFNAQANRG